MSRPTLPSSPLSRTFALVRKLAHATADVLFTGFVIILPFVILGLLIGLALDFTRQMLQPIIVLLRWSGIIQLANFGVLVDFLIELGFYEDAFGVYVEFIAVLTFLGTVIALGVFASFSSGKRAIEYVDDGIASVPGLGPIYESFRRVGDIILEDGFEDFRSVKLVKFPNQGGYSLAFETNEAPESIRSITEEDGLVSLFVPFSPNPVMGGLLVYAPQEYTFDVDMTVEEAARAIITSGVATGEDGPGQNHRMSD